MRATRGRLRSSARSERDAGAAIVAGCRRLHASRLITATEGNVSVRLDDRIVITGAGWRKSELTEAALVQVDLSGRVVAGRSRPSSELPMHIAIYEARPDVTAIVHAHPPWATAFAVAGLPLDANALAESVLLLGPVPLVPYEPPSTEALARVASAAARDANAMLLANHGAVTVSDSLDRALERMEALEQLARVSLLARLLGGAQPLGREQVEALKALSTAPYRTRG